MVREGTFRVREIIAIIIAVILTCPVLLTAQETQSDSTRVKQESVIAHDSLVKTSALKNIALPRPSSIQSFYQYDPVLNRYIYTESVGGIPTKQPLILTPKEFQELIVEEEMHRYFQQKSAAKYDYFQASSRERDYLLPSFYVQSSLFENIFGGSEIQLIPQGSVEMDLGVLYSKSDNPVYSPRNRSNLSLDFDQRIQLSMLGNIGERLSVRANYDTESTFDFQNQLKLEYTPDQDDIVQKIEVGNVSMPLNNSLIQGAQSLFGVKTELQFGKTRITGVFSEQKTERSTLRVEGGASQQEFEMYALDYDHARHFFLAHYFRDQYDKALENYPFISSNIQIQRVEIWVTNRANNVQYLTNSRNIVAIQDLGETQIEGNIGLDNLPSNFFNLPAGSYPDNQNNILNPQGIEGAQQSVLTRAIRDIASVESGFGNLQVDQGTDYIKLENARQLSPSDYKLNSELGYISLNQRLNEDEILAVAFQFTVGGEVYQVGEFANDGMEASNQDGSQVPITENLVVKLLKSSITTVDEPNWDLMMKNIYSLGASQLEQEGFELNIVYSNPQALNYLEPAQGAVLPQDIQETTLLKVFNLDQLNTLGDPVPDGDGFFDFVPGITVDQDNGKIIFTSVEPFGEYLFRKLSPNPNVGSQDYHDPSTYNANQEKYVFSSLYKTTKTQAQQQQADKNKFQLRGRYRSFGDGGIPIGAFNIPQGSVSVTAGGRMLQEGVDYVVNYQMGMVDILDQALLASNIPIEIATESNALFGQQTKRFIGIHVEHQFSDNFLVGGTYLNLNERPMTQKSSYSYEPVNNSIMGFNFNYSTQLPFLTRFANKLPNIDTEVQSNFSLAGELAYLHPGTPKDDNFRGKATTYLDDFEASQTSISISNPLDWELSSVPVGFGGELPDNELSVGYRRAKLNWYTIDPIFYGNRRPSGITDADLSNYATRRVFYDELFPNVDITQGQSQVLYTMDLVYYPEVRGPYNYNPVAAGDNILPAAAQNFAGITRGLDATNFEQSNVEYIEFWLMDPFIYEENASNQGGSLRFNLGSISEDVLKDGRKQFENGLPEDGSVTGTIETAFGRVPANQALVYAFSSHGQAREHQDLGLDGLSDDQEAVKFPDFASSLDPSADNYEYYLNRSGGILERYYHYNGLQGNALSGVSENNRGNTTLPSVEDVNRDNTMNTVNSYFEYEVELRPGMNADNNIHITDVKEITTTLENGTQKPVRWVQFKVPIFEPEAAIGGISDFRSIRFMRLFLTEFEQPTVLRFGTMGLVRGDYRRFTQSLETGRPDPTFDNTLFEVTVVNIEENENRQPVAYVMPPGVQREEIMSNNSKIRQNEQSLSLRVGELQPQKSRAVYKNFQIDMRQYKNLEMFLHLESIVGSTELQDAEMVAFLRMGGDFTENYYQIEIPLRPTPFGASHASEIWPDLNQLNLPLELLQQIKAKVVGDPTHRLTDLYYFDEGLNPVATNAPYQIGELRIGIKGNPSFGNIRTIMLGVKNGQPETGGREVAGEIWFNELRLSELSNEGGWAGVLNLDVNMADFASVSAIARRSTVGYGSIEQGPNLRSQQDVQQYDALTSLNVDQLLPARWGVKIPVSYSLSEELITPKYDPEYSDLELEHVLDNARSPEIRNNLKRRAENYTKRQSISVIGLRKERMGSSKQQPYDIENFTLSTSYNQVDHRDFEIARSVDQQVRVGATYEYNFAPISLEPFKSLEMLHNSEYLGLIRDFNINPLPSNVSVSSDVLRQYHIQKFREHTSDPGFINGIPTLYHRNFLFDWEYRINFDLTKSLKLNFNSATNRVVHNYLDHENNPDVTTKIWDGFFSTGEPNQHFQSVQINYDLPLAKVPLLDFIRATYSYTGNFQWQRGSRMFQQLEDIPDLGNTIQNSNTHQINASLSMTNLYNYLGLKKRRHTKVRSSIEERSLGVPTLDDQSKVLNETSQSRMSTADMTFNTFLGILTSLKRVQLNYQVNNGMMMPGYTNSIGFMGTWNPTPGFTFGMQQDIRHMVARKGWLTLYQDFNQQYSEVENSQFNLQANLDLLPDLTLDLMANRMYSETFNENYRVEDSRYISLTPMIYGNFNISTILIKSAFSKNNGEFSAAFDQFKKNRLKVAKRLAALDNQDPSLIDENGYPVGYGKDSQKVLLPAFLAAYSGSDAEDAALGTFRNIPLPNWQLKYTGLMRLEWFKDRFRRFSVNHGYNAGYTINQFQTNLSFDPNNPRELDQGGNYINQMIISNVNLTEQFSPLIRMDMEMINSVRVLAEVQRDRALSLSFANNLLTEIKGYEYILGLGYRVSDLQMRTNFGGRRRILSSDLNLKADVSYRQNQTIVRYLDRNHNQITAGQDIWSLSFTADYALTKNLTTLLYYDHSFSQFATSNAFPQTTIRSGITLRYNFGN